jgi:serine/threonine protein kinase
MHSSEEESMPKVYQTGEIIQGTTQSFEIIRFLNQGNLALAYEVKSVQSNERFFLKQYISPTPRKSWYSDFVAYQEEFRQRIQDDFLRLRTLQIVDFFEFPETRPNFYQVFEFIDTGSDLSKQLQQTPPLTWEQRVKDSMVFIQLLIELHKKKIIHSDLKPENILIVENSGRRILKLIDMDYSILSDVQPPPWLEDKGYIGTEYYTSPEHITGRTVDETSDNFTAGLILYELLTGKHPYRDAENYARAVQAYNADVPNFSLICPERTEPLFTNQNDDAIARAIHGLLNPDQEKRTTLEELTFHFKRRKSSILPSREEEPEINLSLALTLYINRSVVQITKNTKLGRRWAKKIFGDECLFWEKTNQFELKFKEDKWYLIPNIDSTNETLVNEKKVLEEVCLQDGDVLAIGRENMGVIKTEIVVKYSICPSCNQNGYIFPGPCSCCNFQDESALHVRTLKGKDTTLHIGRVCNKYWAKIFFKEEYKFWDRTNQFQLIRDGSYWIIFPNADAVNETMVNGRAIYGEKVLRSGDRIGVGRQAKGIETSILYVDFLTTQNLLQARE